MPEAKSAADALRAFRFRYSAAQRAEIRAALPRGKRSNAVLAGLRQAAREFLVDQVRSLKASAVERREKLNAAARLAGEANAHDEEASLRQQADAYGRLIKANPGVRNLDLEIFYFRVLSIWTGTGGSVTAHYTQKHLEAFVIAAVKPVLGKALKPVSIRNIVRRYIDIQKQGHLGTVAEFKAGQPLIAGIDRYILAGGTPGSKPPKKSHY